MSTPASMIASTRRWPSCADVAPIESISILGIDPPASSQAAHRVHYLSLPSRDQVRSVAEDSIGSQATRDIADRRPTAGGNAPQIPPRTVQRAPPNQRAHGARYQS